VTGSKPLEGPAADRLLKALETMPVAFFSIDETFCITYVNSAVEQALDLTRQELIGRPLSEALPASVQENFETHYQRLIEDGGPISFEEHYEPLGSWFEVHAWLDGTCVNVTFSNIDERRTIASQRMSALADLEQANARLQFLTDLSAALSGSRSRQSVFEQLAKAMVPAMADWCTIVVPETDSLVRVAARHKVPALDRLAKHMIGTYPHPFDGPSPGVVAYKKHEQLRLERLASQIGNDLDQSADSTSYLRTLHLLGDGPGLVTPIISRGSVVAVLTMVRTERDFEEAEAQLVREATTRVAGALDEASYVETQRQIANALQSVGLPRSIPQRQKLVLAAGYRAASRGSQVGGDWYDGFELDGTAIALVVGDASGHGLQAASFMAQLRNSLRAYAFAGMSPLSALAALSRMADAHYPEDFATVICLYLEPETGDAIWASAGHPMPVLVNERFGARRVAGTPCPPVGWPASPERLVACEQSLRLEAGDRLLMYTDGLVERRGVDLDIGTAQLMILAERTRPLEASAACQTILDEILGQTHEDDVCLLIADYTG
jgi:PAS domain S-box-containing protein